MSDTATLEVAPETYNRSVAEAPKSSKEVGLKGMTATINEAIAGKPELKVEKSEVKETDTSLLGKLEAPKKEDVKKTTREDDVKALKTQRDEHEKNWKTVQAELETVRKTHVPMERLTAAEQRAADMEKRVEIQNLENSPKFAREFTEPRIQLIDQAKELAKDVLGDEFSVDKAVNLMGKSRREFLDEAFANASPSALAEMAGLLTQIDSLDRSKASALTNWKKQRDAMSEQERAEVLREAEDGRNEILRAFDASKNEVASKIPGFREIIGNEPHNQSVSEKYDRARKLLTGEASVRDQASAAYLAVECADALKREVAKDEQIATLTERLRKFEENKPDLNGGSDRSENGSGKLMGMTEYVKTHMRA